MFFINRKICNYIKIFSSSRKEGYKGAITLKKVGIIFIGVALLAIITYFATSFYTTAKLNHVKENVLENHSDIDKIISIQTIGQWGEWFSQYVLIVELNNEKYRIWTNDKGEIQDKEVYVPN